MGAKAKNPHGMMMTATMRMFGKVMMAIKLAAAEGSIVATGSGRRYLLGKPATFDSLAAEREAALKQVRDLRTELEALKAQMMGRKGQGVATRAEESVGAMPDGSLPAMSLPPLRRVIFARGRLTLPPHPRVPFALPGTRWLPCPGAKRWCQVRSGALPS